MIALAIETATRDGSLAVARDGVVVASAHGDGGKPHATRLPGDALDLLARAGVDLADVDLFVVCLGPGAFTGLRVGIAAAQGLAFATGRPIAGVSALDALAALALEPVNGDGVAGVWMDAARSEVFAARYVKAPAAPTPLALDEPLSAAPAAVSAAWNASGPSVSLWIGDGTIRYRDILPPDAAIVEPTPLLAPAIAVLGDRLARAGRAGAPHALRPVYVRASDAELARLRRG